MCYHIMTDVCVYIYIYIYVYVYIYIYNVHYAITHYNIL